MTYCRNSGGEHSKNVGQDSEGQKPGALRHRANQPESNVDVKPGGLLLLLLLLLLKCTD